MQTLFVCITWLLLRAPKSGQQQGGYPPRRYIVSTADVGYTNRNACIITMHHRSSEKQRIFAKMNTRSDANNVTTGHWCESVGPGPVSSKDRRSGSPSRQTGVAMPCETSTPIRYANWAVRSRGSRLSLIPVAQIWGSATHVFGKCKYLCLI